MDIMGKRSTPDGDGVRIAFLDEAGYRTHLWGHQPITDFWHVGGGYAAKLRAHGMVTMGDVARCSLHRKDLLYRLFGVNAEVLIDHAWGYEPVTMADIHAYRPKAHSLSSGQVLPRPYTCEETRLIVREMTELLVLDMVAQGVVTRQVTLTLRYDRESLSDPQLRQAYIKRIGQDHYGRAVPRHAHGTCHLHRMTSSGKLLTQAMIALFQRIADPALLIRQVTLAVQGLAPAESQADLPS